MTNTITEALAKHLRSLPERGDEHLPHISDLYACDRATWARRAGKAKATFDDRTLLKFAMGHAVERIVAEALHLNGSGNVECHLGEMVGHADGILENEVLEIKSTSFLRGQVPTEPQEHYQIQALGYATALGRRYSRIFVVCRESGKVCEFKVELTPEREAWVRARAEEVIVTTDPDAPEPKCNARYPWQKRQCEATDCGMKA